MEITKIIKVMLAQTNVVVPIIIFTGKLMLLFDDELNKLNLVFKNKNCVRVFSHDGRKVSTTIQFII